MTVYRHNISFADKHYAGRGRDRQLAKVNHALGAEVVLPTLVSFGTPALGDADFVVKAATSTELPDEAGTVTYTTADDAVSPLDSAMPDPETIRNAAGELVEVWDVSDGAEYGRNLVSVVTHSTAVVAMTILYSGYDYLKRPVTELHTITATGTSKTVIGTKAFMYLASVAITAAADASANTLNAGTGAKLGLPYALQKLGHMLQASIGGAQELINVGSNATVVAAVATTATNATGDVRGTIAFNTALDGTKEPMCLMVVEDTSNATGLLGIDQA